MAPKALQIAALAFLKHDQVEFAQEVMLKLEDWPALVQLHCNAEAWDRAFMTVKRCPEDEPALFETYAEWLVTHGRWVPTHVLHCHNVYSLPGYGHAEYLRGC